jgi:hypothetical protein
MKKQEVKIKGEVYTVSASTELGLKNAIKSLKKSIKRNEQKPEEGHGI